MPNAPVAATSLHALAPQRLIAAVGGPGAPSAGTESATRRAVVLQLDIRGFTRMATEWGDQGGQEGTDRLSRVLAAFFAPQVALVTRHGGELLRFAGDALLAWWEVGEGDPAMADAVVAAHGCARAMIESAEVTSAHASVQLQCRVAIACGPVWICRLGGHDGHWDALLTGGPVRALGPLLASAASGTVALSDEALQVWRVASAGPFRPLAAPVVITEAADVAFDAEAWVLPWLRSWLGGGVWPRAEMRTVSVAFVSLGEPEEGPEWARWANGVVRALREDATLYGGAQTWLAADDKGCAWLGVFGLVAGERAYRPVDAARWATRVTARPELRERPVGVGVATGRVYCGRLGGEGRWEFASIGAPMVLAARLSTIADGGVRVDEATAKASSALSFTPIAPVMLKGFVTPVPSYTPAGATQTADADVRFVARTSVADTLSPKLGTPHAGRRGWVRAESGAGKTRLASEVAARASASGMSVLWLVGDLLRVTTPLHAWDGALEALYLTHVDPDASLRAAAESLTPPQRAVLGRALGLPPVDQDPTTTARGLRAAVASAVASLCAPFETARGLLLVVDDAQWLDGASHDAAIALLESLPGVNVLLLSRADGAEVHRRWHELVPPEDILELAPLDAADTRALLEASLNDAPVPEVLEEWISRRCAGNPFLIREALQSLRGAGLVTVSNGVVHVAASAILDAVAPPATIEGSVNWRFDGLAEGPRALVRLASVLGMRVELSVAAVLGERLGLPEVGAPDADALVRASVWAPDGAPGQFRFRHRVLRDVAYGSLVRFDRFRMHEVAAAWMESAGEAPQVIAGHLEQTDRPERAIRWFDAGANDAARLGADGEAFALLGRAVAVAEAARGVTSLDSGALSDLLLRRAHAGSMIGRPTEAGEASARALQLLGHPMPTEPRAWKRLLMRSFARQVRLRWCGAPRPPSRDQLVHVRRVGHSLNDYAEATFFGGGAGPTVFVSCVLELANFTESTGQFDIGVSAWGELAHQALQAGWDSLADTYLALARRGVEQSNDPQVRLRFFQAQYTWLAERRAWDDAQRVADKILEVVAEPATVGFAPFALFRVAGYAFTQADAARLHALGPLILETTRRTGSVRARGWAVDCEARARLLQGDFAGAERVIHDALARMEGLDPLTTGLMRASRLIALTRLNRRAEADAEAAAILELASGLPVGTVGRMPMFLAPAFHAVWTGSRPDKDTRAALTRNVRRFTKAFRALAPIGDWLVAGLDGPVPVGRLEAIRLDAERTGVGPLLAWFADAPRP